MQGYNIMMWNFKKCEVQVIQVHTHACLYMLVRTGTDINHKHSSFASPALYQPVMPTVQRVSTELLACTSHAVASLLTRLPSPAAVLAQPMGSMTPCALCGIEGVELPARNKGMRGPLPTILPTGSNKYISIHTSVYARQLPVYTSTYWYILGCKIYFTVPPKPHSKAAAFAMLLSFFCTGTGHKVAVELVCTGM